jgi:cell division protein FtsB
MKKKDNVKLVQDENNKNAFSKTEIITIFISAIALLIAGVSLWITYNTFAYERKLQSLEKRTEKLYKLSKVSQNLESNINFLKTNKPRNQNCQKDYQYMIEEGEKGLKFIEAHYNYVEKASLDSNALKLEKSMPEINKILIQYELFPEMAKQMVEYCRIHHNHDKEMK